MFRHFFHDVHDSDVDRVFNDALVETANDVLDHAELLEQFTACVQHLVGENIFLPVNPQVGESLLRGVQYFSQVTK